MTRIINVLKSILTPLLKIQQSVWIDEEPNRIRSCQALATYKALFYKFGLLPITLEDIEKLLPLSETDGMNFCKFGKVLYLPPLEKDARFVPILSLSCTLKETRSIAQLKVMLVSLDDCFEEDRKFYGIGFRMETPESWKQNTDQPAKPGRHDFHHAQLIQKFDQKKLDKKVKIECPCWIPVTQPSFPLPAECPVTLLLCLIVTLYGRKYYNDFMGLYFNNSKGSEIKPYKDKLDPWINSTNIQQVSTQPPSRNR